MAIKALALIPLGLMLCGAACQTNREDGAAQARLNVAATTKGQAAAASPRLVPPGACVDHMERVQQRDEPWVIFGFRWEVAADNRDKQADDCRAYFDDLNRKNAQIAQERGT